MTRPMSHHAAQTLSCLFLSVCFLFLLGSQSAAESEQTKKIRREAATPRQSTTAVPIESPTPSEFSRLFFGTTGDKQQIQMVLTRRGHDLQALIYSPEYFLRGTIDENDHVALERSLHVTIEGIWGLRGRLTNEVIEGHELLRLTGDFTGVKGNVIVSVVLMDRYELGDSLSLVTARSHVEIKNPDYSVNIIYPQIEPATGRAAEEFNCIVQSKMDKMSGGYTQAHESFPETQDHSNTAEGSTSPYSESFHNVDWQLVAGSSEFLSILFWDSSYGTGAAHPIEGVSSLNYDMKTAKTLALRDLFLKGSNFLRVISDYCLANLAAREVGNEKWRNEGAGPEERNYQNWVVVPEGIRIHFNKYQVASYAEGEQTVVVPFSVFEGMLKPEKRWIFQER